MTCAFHTIPRWDQHAHSQYSVDLHHDGLALLCGCEVVTTLTSVCPHVVPGELPGEAEAGSHARRSWPAVWPAVNGGWGPGGPAASIKVI